MEAKETPSKKEVLTLIAVSFSLSRVQRFDQFISVTNGLQKAFTLSDLPYGKFPIKTTPVLKTRNDDYFWDVTV